MSLPSPVAVNNMDMPVLEENIPKYNVDQDLSMYIPYVSADAEFIKDTIEEFGFGKVKRVDCVARGNHDRTSMAFIHMENWEENALVENFQYRIKTSDMEARIVYDDPKYWIILPNKNPSNIDLNEKIDNMQSEINFLRNYNEELNEKMKKISWFINLHEANIDYLCKEITKLNVVNRKTSSEEDFDNYLEDHYDSNVMIHKKKRVRESSLDNTCGNKSEAWEPSSSSNEKNNWMGRLRPRENGVVMNSDLYSDC
jgi:hypothetical protein